jgi:ABC-type phosphate/phosphonate transport system substrate-binding protein
MIGVRLLARGAVALLIALVPAVASWPAGGEEALTGGSVRVGVVHTLFPDWPEALIPLRIRPFKALLDSQSGVNSQFTVAANADELARRLMDGKDQFGVFHGIEFAWVRQKYPKLQALVVAVPRKELRACLVVRRDSAVCAAADLKGKPLALPCHAREHCRVFLRNLCRGCGESPQHFFTLSSPANFEQALAFVLNGRVQAAVIDGCMLEWFREHDGDRSAQLKTVQESPAFPGGVIVYCQDKLTEAQCERLRDGLLAAGNNDHGAKVLDLCQISRFEPAAKDYDASLEAIVKSYPPEDGAR